MKKLFKEIWKSLSKTKALIAGLTVLIFLSSGVFTLLNDVKSNYTSQFEDYKTISKIHDLTVDTEITTTGTRPSKPYIDDGSIPEKTEYVEELNFISPNKTIRFADADIEYDSKNEGYIKLSKLSIKGSVENENYLKVTDLYRFFQTNNIVSFLDIPWTGTILPENFLPTPFQEYKSPGVVIPTSYIFKTTDIIKTFKYNSRDINFGDLVTIIPGKDGWLSYTDDKITNVKSIYLNAKTKEATISQSLKQSWEKQGILITLSPDEVANLLGFKKDPSGRGAIYSVDTSLGQKGIFELIAPTGNNKWRLGKSLGITINPKGFSLNYNNTITSNIINDKINQFFVLNQEFIIQQNWLVKEKISYEYERYHTKLNYDFSNPSSEINKSWTKNYKEFISGLNTDEQKYYSQTSYWKKTQIIEIVGQDGETVIDPKETIYISQKITAQDLNKKLKPKESLKINQPRAPSINQLNPNSILWIERESGFISQASIDAILVNPNGDSSINTQTILNDSNSKNTRINQIDNGAKDFAQQALYQEILRLVGSIQNIGLRENMTVSGINDGVTNTFHFINGGNNNQEIKLNNDIYVKQNVGKLYNESSDKSLLFELSSKDDIKSPKVPQDYIFSILEIIFNGMSVDKNYINPIITYENYEYTPYGNVYNTHSNKLSKMNNAKIIRMQDSSGNVFGITKQAPRLNETKGKYYVLKEQSKDGKSIWVAENVSWFNGDDDSLKKFIETKSLNFANITSTGKIITIVGPNGWAKQNLDFENKYSIPFKILVPGSAIIDNWHESNNFNVFRDNLINSLTTLLQPLISEKNLKIFIESLTTSFSKNGFSDVLVFPSKIENRKLQKILFGIFYEGAKNSDEPFWNQFIDDILGKIINNPDPNYIKSQIDNIDKLLKLMFGNDFDLNSIIAFAKDPKEVLIGLKTLLLAINIDETIITIWDSFYDVERPKYEVLGTGDILPVLLNNINPDNALTPNIGFKAGLKQIVTQIDFAKLIKHIKENVLDAESLELFGPILDQLNGNFADGSESINDYSNINVGLNRIIDLIDISSFSSNIKNNSKMRNYFVDAGEDNLQEYWVNSISISGISASLLSSLGNNNDNDDELHKALIELFNISSKTSFQGVLGVGVYQPESDPNKLDLRDLQSLLKSPTPELDDLQTSLEKLSIALQDPEYYLDPNSTLGKYLTDYIFNFADDISIQNEDIKKRVDIYLEFMSQTEFINFDPNMASTSPNGPLGGNKPNPTEPDSLADIFINMINPNTNNNLDMVASLVYGQFYNVNNPLQSRDMTTEILNFFSFWMKLSEINLNETPITTVNQVILQIKTLVNKTIDKNSEIGKILNARSQSFNPNILMNYDILDGFSNVKETANKLAKMSISTWLASGFSRSAIDYYFNRVGETLTANNNTISLVSALSSIISEKTNDKSKANLITENFVNMFLINDDKEKTEIMLTLGQTTINTLSGPTNSIIENLGISSVILNPFNAVLNASTLLWFTVNQNAISENSIGNLAYVIQDKLYNFNSSGSQVGIDYDGFKGVIDSVVGEELYIDNPTNMDEMFTLSLDIDYLDYLNKNILTNPETGVIVEIFGVNISEVLQAAVDSFTEVRVDDYQIVISDVGSYLAKVNDAYLKANKKEVYQMTKETAPQDSIAMQELMKKTDEKYKINVNGLEFLIIGTDSTVDYLYPVTDLNNIQVDTSTQALVYVNNLGFDRVKESNANATINKYFLLIAPEGMSPIVLRDQINKYIYETTTGLFNYDSLSNEEKNNPNYKKAYLYNETNPLKPEIALRVQTIETLISTINNVNLLISSILILLIGLITIFVIKRYISSRSKVLGILKAQGYKSIQIAITICLFALIVSFFGATLGYIAGHFLQLPVMNIFSIYWTLPIGPSSFSLFSLVVTVLIPLIGLILMTILTTLFLLRVKPTSLMDGSFQLNTSKSAEMIKQKFHSRNIKSKFTLSLALNSIWKLAALLISLLFTVTIMSFSFSSRNAFGNAVDKTYENRKYNYKIDLITPTFEGGTITTLDKQSVENLLYVPTGNPNEGLTYLANYFKPGPNEVINSSSVPGYYPNGNPSIDDKHIITKSSFDLLVNSGGIEVNVWNTLFNSMPDSQKTSAIEISQYAAKWLEWTQDLTDYGGNSERKLDVDLITKLPYFKYIIDNENPEKSKFVYRNINLTTGEYFYQDIIITGISNPNQINIRDKYREFLVSAYNEASQLKNKPISKLGDNEPELVQDYFLTFGSVVFDDQKNEKFSYAITKNTDDENHTPTINGYSPNSTHVQILDKNNNNLLELASVRWDESKSTIPVIINQVVKDKRGFNVGTKLNLEILNNANRFTESIKTTINNSEIGSSLNMGPAKKTTWTFEIIGINETFINEEWTTTQKIINDITYLSDLQKSPKDAIPFNGILSSEDSPRQATDSLSLYSENGYWSANEKIDLISENISIDQQATNINIFKELFYKIKESGLNDSVFASTLRIINPNLTFNQIELLIQSFLKITLPLSEIIKPGNEIIVNKSLEIFSETYKSNNVLTPAFKDIKSKDIESGFVSNTTNSINSVSTMLIVLSLAISVTILIMISTLIISENERNAAIFSILGYKNSDKIKLFFSLYIPIIIIAILLSIPLSMLFISMFTSAVNAATLISLSISLGITDVLFSSSIVLLIFMATTLLSWFNLNRIKPIMLLKGE